MDELDIELNRRMSLWKEIKEYPEGKVPLDFVRDKNKRIYIAQKGIFRDKETTKHLTPDGLGVTVSLLLTGDYYPDDLSEDDLTYNYPETDQRKRDSGDICATKSARDLNLPIFVVIKKTPKLRDVKLGWVVDFDDKAKEFLIEFAEERPSYIEKTDDDPFQLVDESKGKTSKTKKRPNQRPFRFQVFKKYGRKCAVCDMTHPRILDAAHICGKEDSGSDDWRNGIVLCKNHHLAFDEGLFRIGPKSRRITGGTRRTRKDIQITEAKLNTATGKYPHKEALRWRWEN